jgi:RecB family endonuclease NucS
LSKSKNLILKHPNIVEAETTLKDAIFHHKLVIIVANCWVKYLGRARSKLEPGERIVIIKEDGSLLIHRSEGYEPVNWQPSGCIFHIQLKNEILELRAVRRQPPESIKIFLDRILMISVFTLKDSGQFSLYASEEDMQKAILLKPSLIEDGFKIISYEKKVEPGFVDVYGVDKEGRFVIVEIKRKTASANAVLQLAKYVEAVKEKVKREVRGILVAPQVAKGVQRLLSTLDLDFKALDPKKCSELLEESQTKKLEHFF